MHLTVGVPVYNAMPHLPAMMGSLLGQSCGSFRLLAVDDGSTDGSLDYLHSIRDSRLTIVSQKNRGLTATLNRMLEEVETPWLVRQDADDIALPNRLETIARNVQRYPDAGMFYSRAVHVQNGRTFGKLRTTEADPCRLREITKAGYLLSICHPSVVLNVKKTAAIGGYRFNLHVEDYDLYWRMALEHEIRFIPEVLVGYQIHRGSVSDRRISEQAVNLLFIQYLLLSRIWNRQPLPYEQIVPKLMPLVDRSYLKFRQQMRIAMTQVGLRKYALAVSSGMTAFMASPVACFRRLLPARLFPGTVMLGNPPQAFLEHESKFWV